MFAAVDTGYEDRITAQRNSKNVPVHKTHASTNQIFIGVVEVVQGYTSAAQ